MIVRSGDILSNLSYVYELSSIINMLNQVCKANRELFARLYPTTLVFKDGSTVTMRWHEPRQILKIPYTLEECRDHSEKLAWQLRRRLLRTEQVNEDTDEVKFDAKKYIRPRKR